MINARSSPLLCFIKWLQQSQVKSSDLTYSLEKAQECEAPQKGCGEGNGTHSSILAWRIPWTEEPGDLQSMGLQRVGHNLVTNTHTHTHTHSRNVPSSLVSRIPPSTARQPFSLNEDRTSEVQPLERSRQKANGKKRMRCWTKTTEIKRTFPFFTPTHLSSLIQL